MRTLRLVLAGLLAALGLVVITDAPSHACSCVTAKPDRLLEWADAVFTGTLTDVEPPPPRRLMSSGDPNTYTFEVASVFEGEVDSVVTVKSAMSGASCGLEWMKVDTKYLVFATRDGDQLWSGLCSGTEPTARAPVDRVAQLTLDPVRDVVAAILALFGIDRPS